MKSDNKNKALYSVTFTDKTHFIGGTSYLETKWLEIPNKKIKRILYRLPNGDYLCLGEYDNYFHMIEAVKDLNGIRRGEVRVEYAYIMGKRKNIVTSYRITLFNSKDGKNKIGDILTNNYDIHEKFIKGLSYEGWK